MLQPTIDSFRVYLSTWFIFFLSLNVCMCILAVDNLSLCGNIHIQLDHYVCKILTKNGSFSHILYLIYVI